MRTPTRIAADRLRAGARTNTGPSEAGRGGVAATVHDQVLSVETWPLNALLFRWAGAVRGFRHGVFRRSLTLDVFATRTMMRFRQPGSVRGFRHGVFSRGGSF